MNKSIDANEFFSLIDKCLDSLLNEGKDDIHK